MEYHFNSDQLKNFLSDKDLIKEIKSGSKIISFAEETNLPSPSHDQLMKNFNTFFYFNKPSENFSYTAAGELLSLTENGITRFNAIEKKVSAIKQKITTNWELTGIPVPLFSGGMKFTVEHNENDWKDFSDSNWFIPEIIFLTYNSSSYIVQNFNYSRTSDIDEVIIELEKKTSRIFQKKEIIKEEQLRINSSIGQSPKDRKKWKNMIQKSLDLINEKGIDKVVLSRKIELMINSDPLYDNIAAQLEEKYPECSTFIYKNSSSVFFGASPERLITFKENYLVIDALAGSSGNNQPESELFSEKNLKEHSIVVEYVKKTITPFCEKIELTRDRNTKKLNNISHIWSEISAELKNDNSMFLLVKELFPTPAICGTPKDTALTLIKKLEDHRRGLYSGIIGWFNFTDAEFYVSIRSALNSGKKIIAYAGCGIVDGSDADEEFNETELKLIPILSLFENEHKDQPQYYLG